MEISQIKAYLHAVLLNRAASFARLLRYLRTLFQLLYRFFAFKASHFWIQLLYFVSLAFLGSIALLAIKPSNPSFSPSFLDMFFMSISAVTVSGLATVEMELLSSSQIVVLTLLMLLGGEVFGSFLALTFRKINSKEEMMSGSDNRVHESVGAIELSSIVSGPDERLESQQPAVDQKDLKYRSVRCLGYLVLGYIVVVHVTGSVLIFLYLTVVSSAKEILSRKGINRLLFSVSVTVSSFANGGLIPTNENMAAFKKSSGILLLVMPQILMGNTLFPLFLRLAVWALRRLTRREETESVMKRPGEIGFGHLRSNWSTAMLSLTVVGFIAVQVALFCSLNWRTEVFDGLNSGQKLVNALFMAVNSRHAGENSIDPSLASPAVTVLFIVMMYLPGCTSFSPIEEDGSHSKRKGKKNKRGAAVQNIIVPQIAFIAVFVMAICIIERRKISQDPLNFSVLNIFHEVTSAYGNVGFSLGYSCARLLRPDGSCVDKPYSFSGWWSNEGKLILALVMLYGRLKKFTMGNGKFWRLS